MVQVKQKQNILVKTDEYSTDNLGMIETDLTLNDRSVIVKVEPWELVRNVLENHLDSSDPIQNWLLISLTGRLSDIQLDLERYLDLV